MAHCTRQKEASLLLVAFKAFIANRHCHVAKRQAAEQADALKRRHLLRTALVSWHTYLKVTSFEI